MSIDTSKPLEYSSLSDGWVPCTFIGTFQCDGKTRFVVALNDNPNAITTYGSCLRNKKSKRYQHVWFDIVTNKLILGNSVYASHCDAAMSSKTEYSDCRFITTVEYEA